MTQTPLTGSIPGSTKSRSVPALAALALAASLALPAAGYAAAVGTVIATLPVGSDTTNSTGGYNGGPSYGLTLDAAGNIYGVESSGGANGAGLVYKIDATTHALSTVATLDNATTGSSAQGGVTFDAAGNLYGTTTLGGANGLGTVFKVAAGSNAATVVAPFSTTTGYNPHSKLAVDGSGNLYGTTVSNNGGFNGGTFYTVASGSNAITVVQDFGATSNTTLGRTPYATPSITSKGIFVSTVGSQSGSTTNTAGISKLNGSSLTKVSTSTVTNTYSSLAAARSGLFYGTAQSSIYSFNPDTGAVTTVVSGLGSDFTYGYLQAQTLLVDYAGNIFTVGYYGGVSEYNSAGQLLQHFPVPANSGTYAKDMTVDKDGNIYVVTNGGFVGAPDYIVEYTNTGYVPEPASVAALGLGGLLLGRRRRKA